MEGPSSFLAPSLYSSYPNNTIISEDSNFLKFRIADVVNKAELYLKANQERQDQSTYTNLLVNKNYIQTLLQIKSSLKSRFHAARVVNKNYRIICEKSKKDNIDKEVEIARRHIEQKLSETNISTYYEYKNRQLQQISCVLNAIERQIGEKETDQLNERMKVSKQNRKRRGGALNSDHPPKKSRGCTTFGEFFELPIEVQAGILSSLTLTEERTARLVAPSLTAIIDRHTTQPHHFKNSIEAFQSSMDELLSRSPRKMYSRQVLYICDKFLTSINRMHKQHPEKFISSLYQKLRSNERLEELKKLRDGSKNDSIQLDSDEKELKLKLWPLLAILRHFDNYASAEDRSWLDQTTNYFSKNCCIPNFNSEDASFLLISSLTDIADYLKENIVACQDTEDRCFTYLYFILKELERRESKDYESIYYLYKDIANEVSNISFECDKDNFVDTMTNIYKNNNNNTLLYNSKIATKFYRLAFKSSLIFSCNTYIEAGYSLLRTGYYLEAINALSRAASKGVIVDRRVEGKEVHEKVQENDRKVQSKREQEENELLDSQIEELPLYTPLLFSLACYHLKNFEDANYYLDIYLKLLPAPSLQDSKHVNFMAIYSKKLIKLIENPQLVESSSEEEEEEEGEESSTDSLAEKPDFFNSMLQASASTLSTEEEEEESISET